LSTIFTLASATETIEQFNKDYYTQICKKLVVCQTSYPVAETLMLMQIKDTDDCVKKLSSRDSAQKWEASLTGKQITFNAQNVPACLASISELTCETIAKRVLKPSGIKGCEKVIEGTILDFKKCASHLECSNSQAACYDTCQPPRPLQCGEELCNASQYCDTVQNKCFSPKAVGEKCANFSQCQTRNCTDGTCRDFPDVIKAGAPCGRDLSNVCAMGHWCSDDLHKCIPFER
jgi:hypothetical protein